MAYKRSIYLINPKFQLKFSLFVCFILFVSSLIYPFTIYDLISGFMEFIGSHMGDKASAIKSNLQEKRMSIIFVLAIWQLVFIAFVFIVTIFMTHKVAGPIFKLQKFLSNIRDGQPRTRLFFRKGDYFQELAEDFNETFDYLEENYKKDMVYLSEVNSYIKNISLVVPEDKKVVLDEITGRLGEIQERYNNM